ncbi:NAD-dependent epimerase/dehydratase family protein [Aquibaculum sediminis]|uniref:NAD-dependent epimerase/dehydratase family protein n=1 Tax=Aquibaculum sediminis TaxID=3231907 RepID=UPI0034563886
MGAAGTLVTGGAGFIGLAVVEQLLLAGERVVILDVLSPPAEFISYADRLPGTLRFERGDVTEPVFLTEQFARHNPAAIVHAAAITSNAARERDDPFGIMEVNSTGTINVLEAIRNGPSRRLVQLSTSGVYGDIANRPGFDEATVTESVLGHPTSLYAISKAAAERAVLRYGELFEMNVVCARIGIAWGPWEYDTSVRDPLSVPLQLLRAASSGRHAAMPRDPFKDWAYSRDIGRAVVTLLQRPDIRGQVFNIGSDWSWHASDWAEHLAQNFENFAYSVGDSGGEGAVFIDPYMDKDRQPLDVSALKKEAGFAFSFNKNKAFADYLSWAAEFSIWR